MPRTLLWHHAYQRSPSEPLLAGAVICPARGCQLQLPTQVAQRPEEQDVASACVDRLLVLRSAGSV